MTMPKTTPMSTPISRRRLLERTAAGLTFTFTIAADPLALAREAAAAQTPYSLNLWVTIGTDGTITIVSPAAELGQGSFTTLPLILAEELDADWSKVRMTYPPVWDGKKYGNPEYGEAFATTSSFAVWGYYRRHAPRRRAGAAGAARRRGGEVGGAGRRAHHRAERGRAQGLRPPHRLWRDRGLCADPGRAAQPSAARPQERAGDEGPQGAEGLPPDRP